MDAVWTADLLELCRDRSGPVHVGAAAAQLDVPRRRIRDLARRERWWQPHPDVVAPPGTERTARCRALAAVAQVAGPDPDDPLPCALGRWSGAHVLGAGPGAPTRVQVLVPVARAPRTRGGPVVVRCRTFDTAGVRRIDGVPVAAPPWLVRSCAQVATVPVLTDLVVDLVQRRRLRLGELVAEHERWRSYPGRARLAEVLDRLDATGRVDSRAELDARTLLTGAGVPLDRGQVAVPCADGRTIHLDLGIAAIRFGVDVDSMLAHSRRTDLLADVRRWNALVDLDDDWRVVRATWHDLEAGREAFLATVRAVVTRQSLRHLGVPWPPPAVVDVRTLGPR